MPRRFRSYTLAAAVLASALGASAEPDTLVQSSPFLPPPGSALANNAATEILEFAGVSTVEKQTMVSIFNTQEKRSRWIAVGASVDNIEVINYDAIRDQVAVRHLGQLKILTLRTPSKVANAGLLANAQTTLATSFPTTAPVTPTPASLEPKKPLTIAQQEEEARMFVADMLDIGMQHRKAYEEAQKKAAADKAAGISPATPPPAPAPAGG